MKKYHYIWEEKEKNNGILYRIYGENSSVELPEEIEHVPLTELHAYAFSSKNVVDEEKIKEPSSLIQVRELAGSYVRQIHLPQSLKKIGSYAFYNCTKLEKIYLGSQVTEIGSDAFMNCRSLKKLIFMCSPYEATGLRSILTQLTGNIQVTFIGAQEAAVFFPEYTDSYDVVVAAHIFQRKIQGEGFRARQCFKDNVFDFSSYDKIFPQAKVEESKKVLLKMAMNRLQYPVQLAEKAKLMYEEYIKSQEIELIGIFVEKKNLTQLSLLWEKNLLSVKGINYGIRAAVKEDWAEGSATLIGWNQQCNAKSKECRYSFDEF